MKVFLPATAVMFFIGRILGGPEEGGREEEREMGRQSERERDGLTRRRKTKSKRTSLVDGVRSRLWNFRNKGEGAGEKGVGQKRMYSRIVRRERDVSHLAPLTQTGLSSKEFKV